MAEKGKKQKGLFSNVDLPISNKYIYPSSRRGLLFWGGLGCIILLTYFFFNFFFQDKGFVSAGALSSSHANLTSDCSVCHVQFSSVPDSKCAGCHDIRGNKGRIYDFTAHYFYKTTDVYRAKQAKSNFSHNEIACYQCHAEHIGREASITHVADSKCIECHNYGSFNEKHPEFQFARDNIPDDANLIFVHQMHVEVIKNIEGIADEVLDQTCMACHNFEASGVNFKAIDFDKHCIDCHESHLGSFKHKEKVAQALTSRSTDCEMCHMTSQSNVLPIRLEQRILFRATFDHSSHILGSNCLDCHGKIAITDNMPNAKEPDESETQNVPGIENCQQCHTSKLSSNRCITCHEFHPNKSLRFILNAL